MILVLDVSRESLNDLNCLENSFMRGIAMIMSSHIVAGK